MAYQPYYQNLIDGNGIERCQLVFEGLRCAPNGELAWQTNKDGSIGSVIFTGQQKFADGTATSPSVTFASDTDSGLYSSAANVLGFAVGGAGNLFLSANTTEQRNGTTAQALNVYNTTNGTDKEYLSVFWSGNAAFIQTLSAGAGSSRSIVLGTVGSGSLFFQTANTNRWVVGSSGHLVGGVDNTYDIGAAGATRPKDYYGAGNITIGGTLSAATAIATIGPATPAGTTSLTFVMMGLAGSITTKTGKVVLTMSGVMADSLANDGSKCQMSYGTGTAPVNGAAVTGTQVGPIQQFNAANVNAETCPYGATWIITGLTPNTTYWFDTALAAITGGTATITQATMVAHDLP